MEITKDSFEKNIVHEWLITNGLGGYASSSICGCNTRKYHGLLVAAIGGSAERMLCLSKINETLIIKSEEYSLSTNECNNFIEKGYLHQKEFRKDFLPTFDFSIKDVSIMKKVAMKYGENEVAVNYYVKTGKEDAILELRPFVNYRSFHETKNCFEMPSTYEANSVNVELNSHGLKLHMVTSGGEYIPYNRVFYKNMYYRVEAMRGLEAYECHYMPGTFRFVIPKNTVQEIGFVAKVDEKSDFLKKVNASDIIRGEVVRLEKLMKVANASTNMQKELAIAADNFIIKKNGKKTIIAGYPWFGDWGRDTFISLQGLTLKLNRFKDARDIILSFKDYIKDGLVPNLISEDGGSAYNSVDASLWYINATYLYYHYTHDMDFVETVFPSILEIVQAFQRGTLYDIKMDEEDFLLRAGNPNTQLTWMDAKVGDVIPTPRFGKPVEINALWYNALKITEIFANYLGEKFDTSLSVKVEQSFKKFYCEEGLLDVLDPYNEQIRPNQIIAIGIPFSPVEKAKAREILAFVHEKLYTTKGLKTLAEEDKEYKPYYFGGVFERDTSYHQGTVWPYLLMFYNEAVRKFQKTTNTEIDYQALLRDGCIGNVCEVYDAKAQDVAKGAFAQAWSVAMMIENLF